MKNILKSIKREKSALKKMKCEVFIMINRAKSGFGGLLIMMMEPQLLIGSVVAKTLIIWNSTNFGSGRQMLKPVS
jgi:hypothetical protein